ncbi:hypothetical protein DES49_0719 [Halospina denitrificans]|uniref:Uncharacterized protein n=1 Tax=Halospina denitrificans TaxID=332522 RepID=A0A4R7K2A5_9GAMM|nr:hypothetical protein [Halospina denitrificans]TDT44606.1 hypothetical protein DES49_0719 [Halospina denitrificans]
MQRLILYIMTLLLLFGGSAMAQDDLDVTMRMVTEDDSASDNVASEIRLPGNASDRAREAAAPGLERANEASEKGREASDAARERARRGLEQRNQRRGTSPDGNTSGPGDGAPDTGGNRLDRGQQNPQ